MGSVRSFDENQVKEIIRLYQSGEITSKDIIAKRFETSKRKIRELLAEHNVGKVSNDNKKSYDDVLIEYNNNLNDGYHYVAICNKTKKEFKDYSNISGSLSNHLKEIDSSIEIPSSFKRRSYFVDNGRFWHEVYFNIIQRENKKNKDNYINNITEEIVKLYTSGDVSSTHRLGELFNLGHKRISDILKSNGVNINSRGRQVKKIELIDGFKLIEYKNDDLDKDLVVECKLTGVIFKDINNKSGCLTTHILNTYGDVPLPTNTYQRKQYENKYEKKWFEEYFNLIEIDKKKIRKCNLCNWGTTDVLNKTGCFENHLKHSHSLSIEEYLGRHPEDLIYHNSVKNKNIRDKILLNEDESVLCLECRKRYIGLTNSHLKHKHNMSVLEYKEKWGKNGVMLSEKTIKLLSDNSVEMNKNLTLKFTSKPQLELKQFIENELKLMVLSNNKKVLHGVELDLFIPSHNIAIEYNGLYWHSEKMGKTRNYHISKTILCESENIRLIHIFEDEWLFKKDIVKNRLKHILKTSTDRIYGRKCSIIEIESDTKKEYLEKNHIQGNDSSQIRLGLLNNKILVGVMTFSKPRRALGYDNNVGVDIYELVRFASDNVIGGADKLLKYFINTYKPKKIISYADRRWSVGGLYEKLGFNFINSTKPNYWYTKNYRKREHRFNYRKDKLIGMGYDPNKSEFEIMDDIGYGRVWDCGSLKYEMKLDNSDN